MNQEIPTDYIVDRTDPQFFTKAVTYILDQVLIAYVEQRPIDLPQYWYVHGFAKAIVNLSSQDKEIQTLQTKGTEKLSDEDLNDLLNKYTVKVWSLAERDFRDFCYRKAVNGAITLKLPPREAFTDQQWYHYAVAKAKQNN